MNVIWLILNLSTAIQLAETVSVAGKQWRPGQKCWATGHKRQHIINPRLRVLLTSSVPGSESSRGRGSDSSCRARDTAATMLDHSRHRGESATKTVKFFVAHTVNCVICSNHTRIDWMLLNFTPVIQQNCHQPSRKFEKSFCAVDRLNCQLELSLMCRNRPDVGNIIPITRLRPLFVLIF